VILTRRKHFVLWAVILATWLGLVQSVAAVGTLYLVPATTSVTKGAEVKLDLRINPGADTNGVQAQIGYDGSKLQFVSASAASTAYPEVLEQNTVTNPITLTRATSGNTVSTDAFIISLRFKALASSGSAALTITGNAALSFTATNPAVQGATIRFTKPTSPQTPGSPEPSPPQSPGDSTDQPKQPNEQPDTTPDDDQPQTQQPGESPGSTTDPAPGSMVKRFWWLAVPGVVCLILGTYFLKRLISNRFLSPADVAAEHPVDTTWANTTPRKPEDTASSELLKKMPGVSKPDPGSLVTPKAGDDKK